MSVSVCPRGYLKNHLPPLHVLRLTHRDSTEPGAEYDAYDCFVTLAAVVVAEYCDERVCVCLSVCLSVREDVSGTSNPIFIKYLCMLAVAAAWSSSGGV